MVLTESELVTLLRQKLGRAKKGNGNWINIPCPTCAPKDAMKMRRGINTRSLATKCFICLIPLTLDEILGGGLGRVKVDTTTVYEEPENPYARILPYNKLTKLTDLDKEHPAIQFLHKDFLYDLERYTEVYGVGYVAKEDATPIPMKRRDGTDYLTNIGHSIIFPVYFEQQLVGWQARYLDPKKKMRYMQIFQKGKYLHNYDIVKQHKTVVVTEGFKKSLKFPNGVATWGKGLTPRQIQLLQSWDNIIFMFDGEDSTQQKAASLTEGFKDIGKDAINIDPRKYGYPSPDEMPMEEAQRIVYLEWLNK